jgi:hypothetical protein
MTHSRSQLLIIASRLAALGGIIGIAAGLAQATVGSRIPDWSGNKAQPVALGVLTIVFGSTALVAARSLRRTTEPRAEALSAFAVWLAFVAVVCSTTVGRLWAVPGTLLLCAAGVTLAACGWKCFRTVVASNWLRGLLGLLGACALLMATSAAPAVTLAAGVIAGSALSAAAILATQGRRTIVSVLVIGSLPFAAMTWWTIVTPVLTVVAYMIGVAATWPPPRSAPL